jgi:hypothetical protein
VGVRAYPEGSAKTRRVALGGPPIFHFLATMAVILPSVIAKAAVHLTFGK